MTLNRGILLRLEKWKTMLLLDIRGTESKLEYLPRIQYYCNDKVDILTYVFNHETIITVTITYIVRHSQKLINHTL